MPKDIDEEWNEQQIAGNFGDRRLGFYREAFCYCRIREISHFCVARRSQKEAGVPENYQTHWLQADITKWKNLLRVFEYVQEHGGADYVLHLAGYYDFTLIENPVYEETNVTGTRYLLELSKMLGVKRFIFSSSLAACKFPPVGRALTEKSPVDADFPYARSKRKAEAVIEEYSETFPCSIVRLTAVFSDWCEYPILYMLLKSWFSKKPPLSRVLGGTANRPYHIFISKTLSSCSLEL